MIQASTLKFLKDLKKNNNKPWFDANRGRYDDAKKDFEQFIQAVIEKHSRKDKTIASLKAKDCMFRINRDIRFAKDKTPYKTNLGASINKDGRKSMTNSGYYFHLQPGESFVGGGLYMPMPEELKKVRQEIDYNFDRFKKIIGSKKFKSFYKDLDKSDEFLLSRIPKGYEADNPAAGYLRLKSYIAFVRVTDAELVSKDLIKKTLLAFETLQPLNDFINEAVN